MVALNRSIKKRKDIKQYGRDILDVEDVEKLAKNPSKARAFVERYCLIPVDPDGLDPLSYALSFLESKDLIRKLADVFSKGVDFHGVSNTMRVMGWRDESLIELIGGNALNWNFRTKDGGTAIMQAVILRNPIGIQVALRWGADPLLKDNFKFNAMDYAKKEIESCGQGYVEEDVLEVMELLKVCEKVRDEEKVRLTASADAVFNALRKKRYGIEISDGRATEAGFEMYIAHKMMNRTSLPEEALRFGERLKRNAKAVV